MKLSLGQLICSNCANGQHKFRAMNVCTGVCVCAGRGVSCHRHLMVIEQVHVCKKAYSFKRSVFNAFCMKFSF